jgi:hypothetical protein
MGIARLALAIFGSSGPPATGVSFAGTGLFIPPEINLVYSLGPSGSFGLPCIGSLSGVEKTRVAPAGSEAKEKLGSTSRPSDRVALPTDMLAEKGSVSLLPRGSNDIDSLASFSVENLRTYTSGAPLGEAEFSETSDFDSLAGLSNCANNPVIDPGSLLAAAPRLESGVEEASMRERSFAEPKTSVNSPICLAGGGPG